MLDEIKNRLEDELEMIREQFRRYAQDRVEPNAHEWHLKDELIPMEIIEELAEMGVFGLTIPEEFGGMGGGAFDVYRVCEEMGRIDLGIATGVLATFLGSDPIRVGGTDEQKSRWLGAIAEEGLLMAYGATEPEAGSDLAALRTQAIRVDDHYVVNGSKIWTSGAQHADWIFCLVRTDPNVPKHNGISFLLFDMESPGVSTRPIKLISGASPFCETFFDNARAEKSNLVGEEGNGWTIAKYLLTHEREMISGFGNAPRKSVGQTAVEIMGADDSGRLSNAVLRQNIAQYQLDTMAFGATMARVRDEARAGQGLGPASSIFKYYGTELNKRRNELNLAVLGEYALGWDGEAYGGGAVSRDWLRSKGNSIEGGTSEVQLNIIAKRVLGLPDA